MTGAPKIEIFFGNVFTMWNLSDMPNRTSPKKTENERSGQVQSLTRALKILNEIATSPAGLQLSEISKILTLAPSTTHRLLTTLQEEKFVQFDRDAGRWQIGIQAFVAGNGFLISRDLVTVARPYMRQLMEKSRESVNLAIADHDQALYLAQVESREMMRVLAKPGGRVPLHCSGVGKAFLAAMPEKQVVRFLKQQNLSAVTNHTIRDVDRLVDELRLSRERGYAIDDEEHAIGLRCVAAIIYDEHSEPIAAISLSGPRARISDAVLKEYGILILRAAADITAAMGGQVPIGSAAA